MKGVKKTVKGRLVCATTRPELIKPQISVSSFISLIAMMLYSDGYQTPTRFENFDKFVVVMATMHRASDSFKQSNDSNS